MNRDDIKTIGQPFSQMTREEEQAQMWQVCSNLCKSIATAYEKAGPQFRDQSQAYWLKSAGFEERTLAFIERKGMNK